MDAAVAVTLPALAELRLVDRARVGGKAAVLGELLAAGAPVPLGFCLPLDVTDAPALWAALGRAYAALAPLGEPVAVRSSALAEDGPHASFAGQYESFLDIRDAAALEAAVRACWASAQAARLHAYAPDAAAGVAVIVQRQVRADYSGVLFTRHPLDADGARPGLWVEYTAGSGEALLGGRAAPYRLTIPAEAAADSGAEDSGAEYSGEPPGAAALRRGLPPLVAQVRAALGGALGPDLDIEWAQQGARFWVLQARPITRGRAAPSAPAARPLTTLWTRANIGEVLPGPVTPLTWIVFRALLLGDLSRLHDRLDAPDPPGLRRAGGRVALRLDALLDSFCYLPGVTPAILERTLGVTLPPDAAPYVPRRGPAVRAAQALFLADGLAGWPRLRLASRVGASPRELDAALIWTQRVFRRHLVATAYAIGAVGMLAAALGPELAAALPGLTRSGAAVASAEVGRELARLAAAARRDPQLAAEIGRDQPPEELQARLAAFPAGRAFWADFAAFLTRWGARTTEEFELAAPRWAEDPSFPLARLRAWVQAPPPPAAAVEETDLPLTGARRLWARHWAAAAAAAAGWRELLKYRLMEGFAALRRGYLAQGAALTAAGWLGRAEDVFFLTPVELATPAPAWRDLIAARRAVWEAEREQADVRAPEGAAGTALQGIGASRGVVEGTARVLLGLESAAELRPGEILVTPHTDPGWTPLFLTCAAVVTEIGGMLSHGATVAREYGLPCVVNVTGATRLIHSGDRLRVDGASGRVEILRR